MKNYELTVVLPGNATAAKKKDLLEKVEKMVKAMEGKIVSTDEWGVKELAYTIKKQENGLFICFELELLPASVKGLNDKIKLDGDIIRHLLVVKEHYGKKLK